MKIKNTISLSIFLSLLQILNFYSQYNLIINEKLIHSKKEKNSTFETITEDDVSYWNEGQNDYNWVFNLQKIIDKLGIENIQSIHLYEQEVNFLYRIEWKERHTFGPQYNWHNLYTIKGPGDANGHTGWNEDYKDDHEGDGGVNFVDSYLNFGIKTKIASGWTVTYYDEYLDDGYGWEDNGSGYHWEDYSIYALLYEDAESGYSLEFTWNWDSNMSYDVDWLNLNNSDGILDTIGEFDIEFIY